MTLQGTIGNDEDEDTGYLVELSCPGRSSRPRTTGCSATSC